jgi:DMSO/TMAO reductase YedYZ molybdopterin-dependent catalytic subunit
VRATSAVAIIVVIAAATGIAAIVYEYPSLLGIGPGQPVNLTGVEVDEYQGQQLSSFSSLRDVSIAGTQYLNIITYRLNITGMVQDPQSFTYYQVIDDHQNYLKVVTLNCVEGWEAKILWQGVLVSDLIEEAKPDPNANTVIFHCADNYTTSLPLDYLISNQILLGFKADNVTLTPDKGFPFQLVAESKWGYKWAKWITSIELTNDSSYRGYWESRGYTNSGDLNSSYIGP